MSLRDLLGDIAANVAAGFAEEMADVIKQEAQGLPCNQAARTLGHELAAELLSESKPPPLVNKAVKPDSPQLIERPLVIDGQPVEITPETLQILMRIQQQRRLP